MLWHATGGIEQVVAAGSLHEPRAFHVGVLILKAFLTLVHGGRAESLLSHREHAHLTLVGDHVAVEFQVVDTGITPHEPCLSVVVDHHRGVYVVPLAVFIERFPDGIAEGTCRRVADCHADGHATRQFGVGTDIPVELTVALNGL